MALDRTPRNEYDDLGFDPNALREKYKRERDKRIRVDGNDQYREVVGALARYVDDPHANPDFTRAPLSDEVEVVVIGGGFGGLLAGARLNEAGIRDVRVIETGGDFGGTWYWNRYPGAQCDIEAYIYMPLLEELGYMPKEKYAYGPEIRAHCQAIGRRYDLYTKACFQTRVTELRWDDEASRWTVFTDRDDRIKARFVCMANGPLSRPKLPGIPGLENFEGHTFHTSRWDYTYTGGDSSGHLTGLRDKRVGLIGTGATGVQCVPHLAEAAEQLFVFQRTPSSIDLRANRPTDPEWEKTLTSGWQQRRMSNFNILVQGGHQDVDLVNDGWTDIVRTLSNMVDRSQGPASPEEQAAQLELADFKKMEQIRDRVDSLVSDRTTAESLKPYYRQFCKRPCFHDQYLPTFNRPNVTLVDTEGKGVERITRNGVVVGGREYPVDCLIFATGFEIGTAFTRRTGYEIIGRRGLSLATKWEKGTATFHGLSSRGFPNCFFMSFIQSGLTPNFPHVLNEQSKHVAYVIAETLDRGFTTVEASEAAEAGWVRTIHERSRVDQQFRLDCTPGFLNNEGKPDEGDGWFGGSYGEGADAFFRLLKEWRERGDLEGLELR